MISKTYKTVEFTQEGVSIVMKFEDGKFTNYTFELRGPRDLVRLKAARHIIQVAIDYLLERGVSDFGQEEQNA